MEDVDLPLDLRDLLCGQGGCTKPYPCPEHQAFESAAIAPPILMCITGNSEAPTNGCTTPAECSARGSCGKPRPLLPYPAFVRADPDPCARLPARRCSAPAPAQRPAPARSAPAQRAEVQRDSAAPTPINDRPTMPLPGRLEQRAAMWDRMDQEHRARQAEAQQQDLYARFPHACTGPNPKNPACPCKGCSALRQEQAEAEEENTPTRPLPRIRPESGHGAEVMEPLPPPRCAKCNSVMVEGDDFNAPLCINSTCF